MDIVEFAEKICGLKLLDFQKQYLTRLKRSIQNLVKKIGPNVLLVML